MMRGGDIRGVFINITILNIIPRIILSGITSSSSIIEEEKQDQELLEKYSDKLMKMIEKKLSMTLLNQNNASTSSLSSSSSSSSCSSPSSPTPEALTKE